MDAKIILRIPVLGQRHGGVDALASWKSARNDQPEHRHGREDHLHEHRHGEHRQDQPEHRHGEHRRHTQ